MAFERKLREEILRHGSLERYEAALKPSEIPTFAEFSTRWLREYVAVNNKASERRNKTTVLRAHLVPAFGKTALDRITSADVEAYKATCQEKGLAPKTINNHLIILRRCLATAVEWDLPTKIPRFRPLRVPPQGFRYLSPDEIERVIAFANEPWRSMIALAADTGVRFSELIALDWTDVDLIAQRITIRRGCVGGVFDSPKNNRIRHLRLTAEARATLEALPHRVGLLFTNHDKVVNDETARRHLATACRSAGIEPIGWHVLRHSFASELVRRGASIFSVKELLGHRDVEVTMRYAHLSQNSLDDSVLLLDRHEPMSTWRQPPAPEPRRFDRPSLDIFPTAKEKTVLVHGLLSGSEGGDRTVPATTRSESIQPDFLAQ